MSCNGCTMCCMWESDAIRPRLDPEEASKFNVDLLPDGSYALSMEDGTRNCAYLEDFGCSIHSFRPKVCQKFDCREMARGLTPDGLRMTLIAARGFDLIIEERNQQEQAEELREKAH